MVKFMGIVILAVVSVMMFACADQQDQTSTKGAKESQTPQQAEKPAAESKQIEEKELTTPTNIKKSEKTLIEIQTNKGNIVVELNAEKAPISVENFLSYVDDGQYEGTIFHRVISNFMIQGGGFTEDMNQKPTKDQIKNEADNGLSNTRGTIAMARTNIVDSATCQFFINVKDNEFLNHQSKTAQGYGYCVFGEVTEGMDVVDAIKSVATTTKRGMGDVPVEAVIIEKIVRK